MTIEQTIIQALNGITGFAKVRYLVAEADPDTAPTDLPLCVLSDGGRNYGDFQTFCGSELFSQEFNLTIIAKTAAEASDLADQVSIALLGIAALDSVSLSFDEDLRAFVAEIVLS